MTMNRYLFWLAPIAAVALVACGDDGMTADDNTESAALRSDSGESDLPDNFPRELIPPDYDSVRFADLRAINGTQAAIFESSAPALQVIDHYVVLLGEPTIDIDAARGGGTAQAQWHEAAYPPWLVAIYGDDDESTVTVSTPPAQ